MGITSAIVLFAVIWFMTFLIVLPLRMQTQGDAGDIAPQGKDHNALGHSNLGCDRRRDPVGGYHGARP